MPSRRRHRAPKPTPEEARREVLRRYARLYPSGSPQFCTPAQAEVAGEVAFRTTRGTTGKVIYPDWETAQQAATALQRLGARPMAVYRCGRSRHGHCHLKTIVEIGGAA